MQNTKDAFSPNHEAATGRQSSEVCLGDAKPRIVHRSLRDLAAAGDPLTIDWKSLLTQAPQAKRASS